MSFEAAIVIFGLLCASCATTPRTIELGDERSFDGLIEVETRSRSRAAWIHPDFDLSGYTRVKLKGAGIEYRPVRNVRGRVGRDTASEFPVSDSAKERLRTIMADAFQEQLAQSERFELTEASGPDVLLVWGGLLDVVSYVPPEMAGRDRVFLSRVGEATLVVELRDSESEATLARILDRRAAQQQTQGPVFSNPATNAAEVRRVAMRWAKLLRRRLDEAPTLFEGRVVEQKEE